MGYLLDTNIVSDFVRYRQGAVARRIRERGEADVLTSIVVAAELRFGAARRGAVRLARRIDEVLARLDVLPFAEPADRVYAELRARLERQGRTLGANDLLIAATALAGSHTLVTADQAFAWIAELRRENWLDAAGGADPSSTGRVIPLLLNASNPPCWAGMAFRRAASPLFRTRARQVLPHWLAVPLGV